MELKEFIKTVLSDITDAVSELHVELTNGAIISPSMPNPIANNTIIDPENIKCNRQISKIDFDIAITTGSSDKVDAGGGIGIHVFSAKIGSDNEHHQENASRISFSIPIVLPTHHVKNMSEIIESRKPTRPNRENDDTNPCTQTRTTTQKPQAN